MLFNVNNFSAFEMGFEFEKWTYIEWLIVGIGALLLLIILILIFKPKRKKNGIFVSDDGETIIVGGSKLWLIDANGYTQLLVTENKKASPMKGKVIYASKESNVITISQEDSKTVRNQSIEKVYRTIDYVSKDEINAGSKEFFSLKYVARREYDRRIAAKKAEVAQKKVKKEVKSVEQNEEQ